MPRPFIPVENTARVEVVFDQAGGIVENVFHAYNPEKWDSTEKLIRLCQGFETWLANHWREIAGGDTQVVKITAQDISTPGSYFTNYVPATTIVGTSTGNPLPRNVTVCMKWDTGFAGRSYRGRTFHVGTTANLLDSTNHSRLSAAGRTAFNTRYPLLQGDIWAILPNATLVVVSYMADGAWRSSGVTTPITSVGTDFRVDTMRRRMDAPST